MKQKMELKELEEIIQRGERTKVDFKAIPLLNPTIENSRKIASELVAFANRSGGLLIFGINNDGSFEHANIDADKQVKHVSNIAKDRCSPPVVFTHQLLKTDKGDALILEIEKRKGIPHAVVDCTANEIRAREYYLRTAAGKRLVDNATLEWLFKHDKDPKIARNLRFVVTYNRENLGLPVLVSSSPCGPMYFTGFFNSLNKEDRRLLQKTNHKDPVSLFIVEVAPYALLQCLAFFFHFSWQIEIFRTEDERRFHSKDEGLQGETISLSDIPMDSSFLRQFSADFKRESGKSIDRFIVPPSTEVKIHSNNSGESYLEISKKSSFSIKIRFRQLSGMSGLPFSHPQRDRFQGINTPDATLRSFETKIASVVVGVSFDADFCFPEISDTLFPQLFTYAETILSLVEDDWDWDNYCRKLPHSKLYSIEDKIDEMLRLLSSVKS